MLGSTSTAAARFAKMTPATGTIGRTRDDGFTSESLSKPRTMQAIFMVVLSWVLFVCAIHYVWSVPSLHLICFPLFPALFALTFAATLPWLVYISWSRDFGHLNPLSPRDYSKLFRRAINALNNNGKMKISGKDL
jgi:hypothetical protein